MGLSEGTIVNVLMKSPAGDPTAYKVRGAVLALRSEEASKVLVKLL
jgi:ferrous iron transport protein A